MRLLYCLIFCFLSCSLLGQAFGLSLPKGKKKLSIPFENYNNFIILDVSINDTLPLKFILDSGAGHMILTQKRYLDSLGITNTEKVSIVGIDQSQLLEASIAREIKIDIHGLKGVLQSMVVLEEDVLRLNDYLGKNVHGVLGAAFFHRFVVKIDYDRQILTLYEPSHFKAPRRYKAIPIDIREDKSYFQGVLMQKGRLYSLSFLIDTGASLGVLLHTNNTKVPFPEKLIRGDLGRGLGGDLKGWIGRLETLAFSTFKFSEVITSFQDETSLLAPDTILRDGVIGGELLNRFTVILNYHKETMYLKPSSTYADPFDYDMCGLIIEPRANFEDPYSVTRVLEDSPAKEADIRPGDEIIKINGRSRNLSVSRIYKILRSEEGRSIHLKLRREGEIIHKVFRLKKMI